MRRRRGGAVRVGGTASVARLLLAGVSVRALAASAARSLRARQRFAAGIVALDYFGDADLLRLASRRRMRVLALHRDLGLPRSTSALGRAALDLEWDALAYSGGLENRPGLLRLLERRGGIVLGNGAAAVRAVRDPDLLFTFLRQHGIPHAPTFPDRRAAPSGAEPCHLWKARRSGGGLGVRDAIPGERRPPGHVLQERLEGRPGSAAFLANGRSAVILGVTEQIVGWERLGGSAFRYGGNVAGPPRDLLPPGGLAILQDAVAAIASRFGLRGLNGVDYVVASGVPRVIEINPRYTASMELFEEIAGVSLFDLHLEALAGAALPAGPLGPARAGGPRFLAKGILYAAGLVRCACDPERLAALGGRDLPARGEIIEAGRPICTLIAAGESPAASREAVVARADRARRLLDPPQNADGAGFPARRGSW